MPPQSGEFDGIELSLLDPDDENDRTILVLAEHPELRSAIESGRDKIHHHGRVVNPQLHLAMHEIVASQLLANEPPQMWHTAQRLINAGYERHEVLHMLAYVNGLARLPSTPRECAIVNSGSAELPISSTSAIIRASDVLRSVIRRCAGAPDRAIRWALRDP